ncbi:MAG: TonB-dependent receptor [Steroidobacteraceae bacterium]
MKAKHDIKGRSSVILGLLAASFSVTAADQSQSAQSPQQSNGPAMTQPSEGLAEIVVTAQKREQNLQDVPVAVTALSGQLVEQFGINTVTGLTSWVPGLVSTNEGAADTKFAVRGVGTAFSNLVGSEVSVAVFVDDVYSAQSFLAGANFFDVDRIEVLKGPQSTLFGRNASAGVINILSKKADRNAVYLDTRLDLGNGGQQTYEGILNYSHSPDWGLRAGLQYEKRNGTFRNVTDGEQLNNVDNLVARIGAQGSITDRFTADATVEYSHNGSRSGYAFFDPADISGTASVDTVAQNARPGLGIEVLRSSVRLAYDITDEIKLSSVTAGLYGSYNVSTADADLTTQRLYAFSAPSHFASLSQELRLNGSAEWVDWFVGGSVVHEKGRTLIDIQYSDNDFVPFLTGLSCQDQFLPSQCKDNVTESLDTRFSTTSWGLFAEAEWKLAKTISLITGVRYSHDSKTGEIRSDPTSSASAISLGLTNVYFIPTVGQLSNARTWSNFSPRAVLTYKPSRDFMFYANVSRGYKGGGFNYVPNIPVEQLQPGQSQTINSFDKETVTSYEAGVKAEFFDHRAQFNAAAFLLDYRNFQSEELIDLAYPVQTNLPPARNRGLDIDTQFRITQNLRLSGSYEYLLSEVREGIYKGYPLPFAPKHSISVLARYEVPLSWSVVGVQGGIHHTSSYTTNVDQITDPPLYRVGEVTTVDARIDLTHPDRVWSAAVIGENLTDKRYFVQTDLYFQRLGTPNVGRLIRGEVTYRF